MSRLANPGVRNALRGTVAATVGVALVTAAGAVPAQQVPPPTPAPTPIPRFEPRFGVPIDFEMYFARDPVRSRRAYETAVGFARCVSRFDLKTARALLDLAPGSPGEARRFQGLTRQFGGCVAFRAAVPLRYLRGALAEIAVLRDAGVLADAVTQVEADRVKGYYTLAPSESPTAEPTAAAVERAARCQSVLVPGLVRKLLEAKPGSSDEAAALDRVYARAPTCAGADVPRRIAASLQRAYLAEALYQWVLFDRAGGPDRKV